MADAQLLNQLIKLIDKLLTFGKKHLISRPEWGSIDFEEIRLTIYELLDFLEFFKTLPLRNITQEDTQYILDRLTILNEQYEKIDAFNVERDNPKQRKNDIVSIILKHTEMLNKVLSGWLPLLTYNQKNITAALYDDVLRKKNETDKVLSDLKTVSGISGTIPIFKHYNSYQHRLRLRSYFWLIATLLFTFSTIYAVLFYDNLIKTHYNYEFPWNHVPWSELTSKFTVLVLLISATAWCGKIYKSLSHVNMKYNHKILAIQTFESFHTSAFDERVKDTVLTQTINSIFSDFETGLIHSFSKTSESDLKIVEVIKSMLSSDKSTSR